MKWTGPKFARDFIAISDGVAQYNAYVYTSEGSPMEFNAPDKAGKYELRYFLGSGNKIIATRTVLLSAALLHR